MNRERCNERNGWFRPGSLYYTWTHFEKDRQLGGIIPEHIMVAPDGALEFFSGGSARYMAPGSKKSERFQI